MFLGNHPRTDASKTAQATSAGPGDAVYVEGTMASTYIGGDKILWQWTENGETQVRTNIYTVLSLRMFADLNLDDTINSNDYVGVSSLTSHGWVMPVTSNAFRKVQLKNDVNFTGTRTLTLSSSDAAVRVWATATPSTNDTPLLVAGQTVTNGIDGIDGADFAGYPESMIYVEAIDSGTATLSYNYVGTGEYATGLVCEASFGMTCVKVELCSVVLDADGYPYIENGEVVPGQPIGFDDVRVTTYVPFEDRGTPRSISFSDSEANMIVFEPDGASAGLRISRGGTESYKAWELDYTNTVQDIDYYQWNGVSNYVHVAFSNNIQNCTSTVAIVIMDEDFTGEAAPVTNSIKLYSDGALPGYHSNYLISEPREDVGMPAFSAHNAFVVRMEPFGIAADDLVVSIVTPDETYDISFEQNAAGSYVSALVVPVPYGDGDVDLGFESSVRVVKLKLRKGELYGWDRIPINIETLGASARKIASGEIEAGNAMLITGVVSNEEHASKRASQAVVSTGLSAGDRLKYGVTPIFTPSTEQILAQLEKHSVWIHSGHGGNNGGIEIVKKVGAKYELCLFKASDINISGLAYDLVFMNTCESTDYLTVPTICHPSIPSVTWKVIPVTTTAVMDIGTALNAKNYIGWDTWVQRELSVTIPKMLMEALDSENDGTPVTVADAIIAVKEKLESEKPKYYWFAPRLNHKVKDDSVIMDLNKKAF